MWKYNYVPSKFFPSFISNMLVFVQMMDLSFVDDLLNESKVNG